MTTPTSSTMATTPTATSSTTRKRRSAMRDAAAMPPSRALPLQKYQKLITAVGQHQTEPGFPDLFADGTVLARFEQAIADAMALDNARASYKRAEGEEAAQRSQAYALFGRAIGALVGFYGPQDPRLADFGVKPKRPPGHRPHKVAVAATAAAVSTSGPTASPTPAVTPASATPPGPNGVAAGNGSSSPGTTMPASPLVNAPLPTAARA
jgi:hypothetical protein